MDNDVTTVKLEDGKYIWYFNRKTGEIHCERYGMPWRNETGDKALLALFNHFTSKTESNNQPLPECPPLETLENGQHFFSNSTK